MQVSNEYLTQGITFLFIILFLQVVRYLAGCGLQSCQMLVSKGYPDIGWNPVEGERYLDFLRFAVFCNGRMNRLGSFMVIIKTAKKIDV